MLFRFLLSSFALCATIALHAQKGYEIKVQVDNYEASKLVLGYQYGGNQYIRDTVEVDAKGQFVFKGDEPLEEGIYLIVLQPNNNFVQFLADESNQRFTVSFDNNEENLAGSTKIKGSPLNKSYYDYLQYLEDKVPAKLALQEKYEEVKDDPKAVESIKNDMDVIDAEVKAYHKKLIAEQNPNLLGRLINARMDPELPKFEGEDIDIQRYLYYKQHYFDNLDLKDDGLLRTGALTQKVDYYIKQLTPQMPDSINVALDYILTATEGSNNFKFFLIHYLNEYASSKIVGMDAIYVHLVEQYYATGKADWTSEEQLKKIVANAMTLKPILIGKTAPDVRLKTKENEEISIHDFESKYTVLFFWDPDCGHCKKSMPDVISFHDKYKAQGVEILGICTKVGEEEEMKKCWDTIEEKEMGRWINVSDQYLRSNYKNIYDIKSTPRIFILDEDKKIVMKGIGAEQLGDVMDQIIKEEQEQMLNKSE